MLGLKGTAQNALAKSLQRALNSSRKACSVAGVTALSVGVLVGGMISGDSFDVSAADAMALRLATTSSRMVDRSSRRAALA